MIIDKLPNKTVEDGDFRMSIIAKPWRDAVEIWIARYKDGRAYKLNLGEDGNMIETEMKEGEVSEKPFLVLPLRMYKQFTSLFNKAEKPIAQESSEAELKATREHLDDMREIAFSVLKIHPRIEISGKPLDEEIET